MAHEPGRPCAMSTTIALGGRNCQISTRPDIVKEAATNALARCPPPRQKIGRCDSGHGFSRASPRRDRLRIPFHSLLTCRLCAFRRGAAARHLRVLVRRCRERGREIRDHDANVACFSFHQLAISIRRANHTLPFFSAYSMNSRSA